MSNIVEENRRIINLLAQGLNPMAVISITGIQPTYMQSLLKDEEFRAELSVMQAENAKLAKEDDIVSSKYLALEHNILKQIESDLGNADFRDVVRALEVVSKRQDAHLNRKVVQAPTNNITINNVQLRIPAHAVPEFKMNTQQEVISVGEQALSPMSSKGVMELFKARKEGLKLVQDAKTA